MLRRHLRCIFSTVFLSVYAVASFAQLPEQSPYPVSKEFEESVLKLAFYNVENLFDTLDSPSTVDEEFTPKGSYMWNSYRYHRKLRNLSKVLVSASGAAQFDILCLAEVENRQVVQALQAKLHYFSHKIVHQESPDRRGIDVALLYDTTRLQLQTTEFLRIPEFRTREVLHTQFQTLAGEAFHLFVNHWPSRWGGQKRSEPKRVTAAKRVLKAIHTVRERNPKAHMVLVGDFNDYEKDLSLATVLGAKEKPDFNSGANFSAASLVNLNLYFPQPIKSSKYKRQWGNLDHSIVSASLLNASSGLQVSGYQVYATQKMLERDRTHSGFKPKRTFHGRRYVGGYSDHFPLLLDLKHVTTKQ